MPDHLSVWLHDRRVGVLERDRRGRLQYVHKAGSLPVSIGLPANEPWTPARTMAWFEGLLPEGDQRARIAARFSVAASDTFALLEQIGWECAGAVAVLPEDQERPVGTYRRLSDDEVGLRLDALPGRPYDEDDEVRVSLGGYQAKLVLARLADAWAEPVAGAASTHILKPEPPQWPGMAAAEAWALTLASQVTSAAAARWDGTLGTSPTLVVTRYDRMIVDGQVHRRHQEDLCQILGLLPEAKYAEPPMKPGKPSWDRLATILLERAVDPIGERLRLLEQVTVTIALGNADAHAKNLSVIHEREGLVSLAPMYDLVPTLAFIPRQTRSALPVAGKFRMDEITTEHLVREAVSWGIPERRAQDMVLNTLAALRSGIKLADTAVPQIDPSVRAAVLTQIERLYASAT